ncbi:MAG: hypothetical protein M1839_005530 [Geoglossum umbratile]|nr:MAG: hypothetical protein M1839_005530 [Geoglossum umbratile]
MSTQASIEYSLQTFVTMHSIRLGLTALSIASVVAFEDTSPFFLFSTAKLPEPSSPIPQILSSSSLTALIKSQLSRCPSDAYVIISQPGANAEDFIPYDAAPHLRQSLDLEDQGSGKVKSSFQVADVVGELDLDEIQRYLETKCEAGVLSVDASTGFFTPVDDMKPRVVRIDFPALPTTKSERIAKLSEDDAFLSSIIDLFPTQRYTVMYTTTPISAEEVHILYAAGQDKKQRILSSPAHVQRRESTTLDDDPSPSHSDTPGNLPLFHKYQFFTPGIFMGLLVSLLLFSILSVGIAAVSSLQVPYGAFEKEMGPAAQKKLQ